jgi:hypothetical protein
MQHWKMAVKLLNAMSITIAASFAISGTAMAFEGHVEFRNESEKSINRPATSWWIYGSRQAWIQPPPLVLPPRSTQAITVHAMQDTKWTVHYTTSDGQGCDFSVRVRPEPDGGICEVLPEAVSVGRGDGGENLECSATMKVLDRDNCNFHASFVAK